MTMNIIIWILDIQYIYNISLRIQITNIAKASEVNFAEHHLFYACEKSPATVVELGRNVGALT